MEQCLETLTRCHSGGGRGRQVYQLPIAAVTTYHGHKGLRLHRCITSEFCSLEVGLMGLKSRSQQGCIPCGGLGDNLFPCVSQLLEAACPVAHPAPSRTGSVGPPSALGLFSDSLFSTYKDPCDYIEPTEIIQDNFPISESADLQPSFQPHPHFSLCPVS